LLLHPGVELGAELVGGAADGLLDVLVVMAGTDGIAVARAGFEGTALVGGATLDGRVVVRQVHLEPAQAAGKTPQVLLDHRAHPLLEGVGAVNLVVGVQQDLQLSSPLVGWMVGSARATWPDCIRPGVGACCSRRHRSTARAYSPTPQPNTSDSPPVPREHSGSK